jgi:enoyl-CoA hydratase
MMYRGFELQDHQKALVVRFNRPEIRNPLNIEVLESLHQLLENTEKTIIFTGSDKVFAAGANLKEIVNLNSLTAREFAKLGQGLMMKIASRNCIAAINGICFGGALDLALNCRKRIASAEAKFCHPAVTLGIITGWSGTQILPRIVGKKKALEIFLTAKVFDAYEALEIGLIDKIVDEPLAFALENLA